MVSSEKKIEIVQRVYFFFYHTKLVFIFLIENYNSIHEFHIPYSGNSAFLWYELRVGYASILALF